MSKFYCNNCEENVNLVNGKCPKCNTNWEKIINDCVESDEAINYLSNNEKEDTTSKKRKEEKYNNKYLANEYEEEKKLIENKKFADETIELDIKDNISFFITYANITKILCIILAVITGILSIVLVEATEGISLILLIFVPILIISAIIFENNMKWKAYMLYTNNSIKNSKKK